MTGMTSAPTMKFRPNTVGTPFGRVGNPAFGRYKYAAFANRSNNSNLVDLHDYGSNGANGRFSHSISRQEFIDAMSQQKAGALDALNGMAGTNY